VECACCVTALSSGGRYIYLWLTTVLHGLVVESASYIIPDIDNFWHAQSMIMLLGRRLPLHILLLCKSLRQLTRDVFKHLVCNDQTVISIEYISTSTQNTEQAWTQSETRPQTQCQQILKWTSYGQKGVPCTEYLEKRSGVGMLNKVFFHNR